MRAELAAAVADLPFGRLERAARFSPLAELLDERGKRAHGQRTAAVDLRTSDMTRDQGSRVCVAAAMPV